jgi:hypothetical protein
MNFPFDMYVKKIKEKLNKEYLDKEERKYLLIFSDSSIMSSSKKIYYYALFYNKRFYPQFLISLIITNKVKKVFKNENAPETIQSLYKDIAELICLSAMGAYAKGKESRNRYLI